MAYRGNQRLNVEIERQIAVWDGTVHGYRIKKAYESGVSYETVCDMAGIDYEEFKAV